MIGYPCGMAADFPKNTNAQIFIIEPDGTEGAYYNTNLAFLPRVGEALELTSYLDMKSEHPYVHSLKVERVEHFMGDITGDEVGHHLARIYARRQS
jgi:hypothetical protein